MENGESLDIRGNPTYYTPHTPEELMENDVLSHEVYHPTIFNQVPTTPPLLASQQVFHDATNGEFYVRDQNTGFFMRMQQPSLEAVMMTPSATPPPLVIGDGRTGAASILHTIRQKITVIFGNNDDDNNSGLVSGVDWTYITSLLLVSLGVLIIVALLYVVYQRVRRSYRRRGRGRQGGYMVESTAAAAADLGYNPSGMGEKLPVFCSGATIIVQKCDRYSLNTRFVVFA